MFDLNVPFKEKDEAKPFGARWDAARRTWYFPGDVLPDGLKRWYDGPLEDVGASSSKTLKAKDIEGQASFAFDSELPLDNESKYADAGSRFGGGVSAELPPIDDDSWAMFDNISEEDVVGNVDETDYAELPFPDMDIESPASTKKGKATGKMDYSVDPGIVIEATGVNKMSDETSVTPHMIAPGVDLNSFRTVSEVGGMIVGKFNVTPEFKSIMVKGEVTNYKPNRSGHYYFGIKDEGAKIDCKMWASEAKSGIKFDLENGQQVAIIGTFEFDAKYGASLHAKKIYNAGEGLYYLELQRLREQLRAEGLFDIEHKKPIPEHPKKIGVVTSKNGQAIQDIVSTARRRNPYAQLVLYSVKVQGEGADLTIVEGIRALDRTDVEVIIVGRGGGSDEDLIAFNSEAIARAVYAAETPIVSAVGHAGNTTLIDEVADAFAVTPTAAAEKCCPDIIAVINRVNEIKLNIKRNVESRIDTRLLRLEKIRAGIEKGNPSVKVKEQETRLDNVTKLIEQKLIAIYDAKVNQYETAATVLRQNMEQVYDYKAHRFEVLLTKLHGLSPSAKLVNGFGYISKDAKPVLNVSMVKPGDEILVTMSDGEIGANVTFANAKETGGE